MFIHVFGSLSMIRKVASHNGLPLVHGEASRPSGAGLTKQMYFFI
jgi:hypothetical protein